MTGQIRKNTRFLAAKHQSSNLLSITHLNCSCVGNVLKLTFFLRKILSTTKWSQYARNIKQLLWQMAGDSSFKHFHCCGSVGSTIASLWPWAVDLGPSHTAAAGSCHLAGQRPKVPLSNAVPAKNLPPQFAENYLINSHNIINHGITFTPIILWDVTSMYNHINTWIIHA